MANGLNGGVTVSMHPGGMVLLHPTTGQLFASNRLGAQIWRGLAERLTVEAIVRQISRDHGIPLATARQDTARFLVDLRGQGLLERAE